MHYKTVHFLPALPSCLPIHSVTIHIALSSALSHQALEDPTLRGVVVSGITTDEATAKGSSQREKAAAAPDEIKTGQ